MKPIWKGYLRISLVTIPVKMFSAVSKKKSVQFNLLHKDCKTRIKQKTYCPVCNKELSDSEIVRGYQYEKNAFVIVTDEELEKVKKESTEVIEVLKFINEGEVHPLYYNEPYYLIPDGKTAEEAFSLFLRAMGDTKKSALGKVIMRNREHFLLIRPHNNTLIAYSLHYPEEIQSIEKIEGAGIERSTLDKNALNLTKTLIQGMSSEFSPEEFRDEYYEAVMEIIRSKIEGKEIEVKREPERAKVISIMDALEKSIMQTQKKALPRKAMAVAGKRRKGVGEKGKKVNAS